MIKRIYLEITDACNLNCPFCTNEKGNNFMPLDILNNYLSQIKDITNYIYLHVLGEPLLHPQFNEIITALDKNGFNLQLVTNGTLLNKYPDILNHQSLRKLSISIHSMNRLEPDVSYFDTINNLIDNNQNHVIELRFYQKDQLDKTLNDYLNYLINKYNPSLTLKNNSYKLKDNVYLYFEDFFNWPNLESDNYEEYGTCLGAKTQLAILHNGEVVLCCLDPKGHTSLGNLNDIPLKEIIESEKYKKIIESFNQNKLICELCKHCDYRKRFL